MTTPREVKRPWSRALAALLVVLMFALRGPAESPGRPIPRSLVNGLNEIDLDGDGIADAIVKAWRENFNAHGFFNYSFYRRTRKGDWEVIPIERDRAGVPSIGFNTAQGADCVLSDLRIHPNGGDVRLVVGAREIGDSYADSRIVTFTWYALKRNEDGTPGMPSLYFAKTRSESTRNAYCDVNEAFERELRPW